jgi:hypothetical protein
LADSAFNILDIVKESNHILRKAAGVIEYVGKEFLPSFAPSNLNSMYVFY